MSRRTRRSLALIALVTERKRSSLTMNPQPWSPLTLENWCVFLHTMYIDGEDYSVPMADNDGFWLSV